MCDLTHLYVWHDTFIRVTWLFHACATWLIAPVRYDSYTSVIWLIQYYLLLTLDRRKYHVCLLSQSHAWHASSFIRATPLIHVCDISLTRAWHDSFTITFYWLMVVINITSLSRPTHIRDMTHSHMWHKTFTCVTWHIHMCDMTHSHIHMYDYVSIYIYTCMTMYIYICTYVWLIHHYSVLQLVAVCCSVLQQSQVMRHLHNYLRLWCVAVHYSVLQCAAMRCSTLHWVAVCCSV